MAAINLTRQIASWAADHHSPLFVLTIPVHTERGEAKTNDDTDNILVTRQIHIFITNSSVPSNNQLARTEYHNGNFRVSYWSN